MTARDQYLASCKERALKYLDHGEIANAIASMQSDLQKHPDFKGIASQLDSLGLLYAMNDDVDGARRLIEGYR